MAMGRAMTAPVHGTRFGVSILRFANRARDLGMGAALKGLAAGVGGPRLNRYVSRRMTRMSG